MHQSDFHVPPIMKLLFIPTAAALSLLPVVEAQTTLFHFRVNDVDAAGLPVVPSVGGAAGTAPAPFGGLLSTDVPLIGVPANAGNRSLVGASSATSSGVNTTSTSQLTNAQIIANGGFTYETWFKWYGGGNVNSIIDYAGTEKLRVQGGLGINFDQGSGFTQFVASPAVNQWHYVAAVFKYDGLPAVNGRIGGTLTYYFNDNFPLGSVPVIKAPFGDSLNRVIGVGRHPQGFGGDDFNGLVYEPRVSLGARANNQLLFYIPPNSNPELRTSTSVSRNSTGNPLQIQIPLRNPVGTTLDLEISSVTLSGPEASSFVVSSFSNRVSANGGSGNATIDFTPTLGGGVYTATLLINSNDPLKPAYEIPLSVDVRDPAIVMDRAISFGTFFFPPSVANKLVVRNAGGVSNLILSNPRFSGTGAAAYSVVGALPDLAPGASGDLEILFAPTTGGSFPAQLTVDTNDVANRQVVITLTGTVQDPEIVIERSVAFGTLTPVPGIQKKSIPVDNYGLTLDLVLRNPRISGPAASHYSLTTAFPLTLPANGASELDIAFDPGAVAGSFFATLAFDTNDPVNPTVALVLSARVEGEVNLEGPSKVSHWTFNNPAELGHDSGGLGYHGTVVGDASFSKLSTVGGGALALTGTGGHLRIPVGPIRYEDLDNDGDGFTIATWVYSAAAPTSFNRQRYFSKLGVDPFGFGVGQDLDSHLLATTYGIFDYRTAANVLPKQDEWHHVAYVFSGSPTSTLRYYVDGVLIAQVGGNPGLSNTVAPAYAIGGLGGGAGEWFDGMLDDLRIYAVELSEGDIAKLAAMGTIGPVTVVGEIAITSVQMVAPDRLRIEFKGSPNTLHRIQSSPNLSTSPFTGAVTPTLNGLMTNGQGNGFVVVPAGVPGNEFFQIQSGN
jgi:hypothetical protein